MNQPLTGLRDPARLCNEAVAYVMEWVWCTFNCALLVLACRGRLLKRHAQPGLTRVVGTVQICTRFNPP